MEPISLPLSDELAEVSLWDEAPPPQLEEQEMDVLAFDLWHLGSCPETEEQAAWLVSEEELVVG